MLRKFFGPLVVLTIVASPAWAQEAAKPEPAAGNWAYLPAALIGFVTLYFVFLMIYVLRRQKLQKSLVDRSLRLSEERNELARQQLAAQAETNRLLEKLIGDSLEG